MQEVPLFFSSSKTLRVSDTSKNAKSSNANSLNMPNIITCMLTTTTGLINVQNSSDRRCQPPVSSDLHPGQGAPYAPKLDFRSPLNLPVPGGHFIVPCQRGHWLKPMANSDDKDLFETGIMVPCREGQELDLSNLTRGCTSCKL